MKPLRKFQVRDVSSFFCKDNRPAFDIVFHDDESRVQRYSDKTYHSKDDAEVVMNDYEVKNYRPTHWVIMLSK